MIVARRQRSGWAIAGAAAAYLLTSAATGLAAGYLAAGDPGYHSGAYALGRGMLSDN